MRDLNDILSRIRSTYTAEDPKDAPVKSGKSTGRLKIETVLAVPVKRNPTAEDAKTLIRGLLDAGKRRAINEDGSPASYSNGEPKYVTDQSKIRGDEAEALRRFNGEYSPSDHGGCILRAKSLAQMILRRANGEATSEGTRVPRDWQAPKGTNNDAHRNHLTYQMRDAEIRNAIEAEAAGNKEKADFHLAQAKMIGEYLDR